MWNLKNKQQQQTETKLIDMENRLVVARGGWGWGPGKMDEGGQKAQTSSYKITKSWD